MLTPKVDLAFIQKAKVLSVSSVPNDAAEGFQRLFRATRSRDRELAVTSTYLVATALIKGDGTPPNQRLAVRYLKRAARSRIKEHANYSLGLAYRHGLGVRPDLEKAKRYFEGAGELRNDSVFAPTFEEFDRTFRHYRRGHELPVWTLIGAGSWTLATLEVLPLLNARGEAVAIILLGAVALATAFRLAMAGGAKSQARIRWAFGRAGSKPVWIGGVKWVLRPTGFSHLYHNGGERGLQSKPETDRYTRRSVELTLMKERRDWAITWIVSVAAGALGFAIIPSDGPLALSAIGAAGAAYCTFFEWLFRSGWQRMAGAMVLDPTIEPSGQAEVAAQFAHGAAHPAEETELRKKIDGDRSPLDRREF